MCGGYLLLSMIFASASLDVDELGFVQEPYEMVGGDYTGHYVSQGEWRDALSTIARSYYLFWKYRPLNAPLVSAADRRLFEAEAVRFGPTYPPGVAPGPDPVRNIAARPLIAPDPDRLYVHDAGKPLLPALVSLPQVLLVAALASGLHGFVLVQGTHNYHPLFIVARLAQLLAGCLTIALVWWILVRESTPRRALWGAALVGLFPASVMWFPNLHHDSILAPFVLLTAYAYIKRRYVTAGVSFGLALASKNVAIFLAPALLAYGLWEVLTTPPDSATRRWRSLAPAARSWGLVMLLGGLVLLPFANPVAYLEEIATPLTRRAYDPRGEQVSRFTVAGKLAPPALPGTKASVRSSLRPAVRGVNSAFGYREIWFLFAVLGGLGLASRRLTPLGRMSLVILGLSIPMTLIFGHDLNYRALMFVPFFALLAVEIAHTRPLAVLLALLLLIDLAHAIDPITATTIHLPTSKETFVSAVLHCAACTDPGRTAGRTTPPPLPH